MESMLKVLEEIRDEIQYSKPKESISYVLSSTNTEWNTNVSLELDPKKHYELALISLETYHSIPNIDSTNNTFSYSPDNGETWKTITISEGSYEIKEINEEIQRQMKANGDWNSAASEYYVTVGSNTATLRAFIEITSASYRVNMVTSTIRSVLAFNPQTLIMGYKEGENIINILSVNSILVGCNLVAGSYINSTREPVVYSFFPDVSPGEKIIERPTFPVYLPIGTSGHVQNIYMTLKDQTGRLLNLRGETVTIRLHIRSA